MKVGVISHRVLQISHIAKEVLGRLARRFDRSGRSKSGTLIRIVRRSAGGRGRGRMTSCKGRNHDIKQNGCQWEDDEKIGIQADK